MQTRADTSRRSNGYEPTRADKKGMYYKQADNQADNSLQKELKARNEELERHNLNLQAALDQANKDKEDLKNIHNNYMLQMQTLINQKAIEAPGQKKKWYEFWK
jgi:hypothetical protein